MSRSLQVGQPVPGSRLLRDYCRYCGDPVRVAQIGYDAGGNVVHTICCKCRNESHDVPKTLDTRHRQDRQWHGDGNNGNR